jgi:hypothetical protein
MNGASRGDGAPVTYTAVESMDQRYVGDDAAGAFEECWATVFLSLDFLYTPAADVDAEVAYLVDVVGATLEWRVRAMATTVACLRICDVGPQLLLAGHLSGFAPVAVYRVADLAATVAELRGRGVRPHELEIPPGPCAIFETPAGQRLGGYELVRPDVANHFAGRLDP